MFHFTSGDALTILIGILKNKNIIITPHEKNTNEDIDFIINFWKNNPDTYFKMVEGCPDYHRVITPELAKNYSVGAVRHSTYFFKWNDDL